MSAVHPTLQRRDKEPAHLHAILLEFAAMGPGRKVSVLARAHEKAHQTVSRWKKKFDWQARLDAYDLAVAEKQSFNAEEKRSEALVAVQKFLPWMVKRLVMMMQDKDTPHGTRLQAIRTGLELGGLFEKHDIEPIIEFIYGDPEMPEEEVPDFPPLPGLACPNCGHDHEKPDDG